MAWQIVNRDAYGRIEVTLDNAPVDILDVLDNGIETGSTSSGINQSTGELEVYWFTKSSSGISEKGTWLKIS